MRILEDKVQLIKNSRDQFETEINSLCSQFKDEVEKFCESFEHEVKQWFSEYGNKLKLRQTKYEDDIKRLKSTVKICHLNSGRIPTFRVLIFVFCMLQMMLTTGEVSQNKDVSVIY